MFLSDGFLDDSDSDSLLHVSDSESTKGRVLVESLNNHRFLGDHSNKGGISGLDEFGLGLSDLTGSSVDLRFD